MRTSYKSFSGYLLLMIAITMISCESFLDRQEDEKMTFEKIWANRDYTRQYWLNAMSFLPNLNGAAVGDADPYLGASDECTIAYDRGFRSINFGSWNASNVPYERMSKLYKGIRECNIFMQNVDRCSDPLVTKDQLAEWKVQARFARAYYYFLMMCDYGPVFLLGDELLDFTATTEALYRPRNTWEQCVKYVVDEMNACADNPAMPSQASLDDSRFGYATKGVCHAVISRLSLYDARPLFNGNTLYRNMINPVVNDERFAEESGKHLFPIEFEAEKWLVAAKAAHRIFEDGDYELYREGDGNDPCANYYGITHEKWNKELIWTDRYNGLYSWSVVTVPTGVAGTAYGGVGPTQQQVDAYAMKSGRYPITGYKEDGSPVIDKESAYPDDEFAMTTWTYPCEGWSKHANYAIKSPNMYKNREPRFYVTVFFGGNYWLHDSQKTMISFAKGANSNKSHDYPKAGYLCNRFYDHKLNSANGQWGNITFPIFRLGEIYLNFIEAVLECKKNGVALPNGYEQEAFEKWDDLRDRSGVPPILTVYPEAQGNWEKLIELCHRERRVELAFERQRYYDTRTWMIAEQTDGGKMYGMDTNVPGTGNQTPVGFWKRTEFETRIFNKNHYLYPFSQRELDRNKLLVQNYGW